MVINKCDNKFCPECGHHLYADPEADPEYFTYWCAECQHPVEKQDAATFEDVIPLRAGYDAVAFRAEEMQD